MSDHINFPLHHGEALTVFMGYGKPLEQYTNTSHGDIWFFIPLFTKSYIGTGVRSIKRGLGAVTSPKQVIMIEDKRFQGLVGYIAVHKLKSSKRKVGDIK